MANDQKTQSQAYEAIRLAQLNKDLGEMASSAKLCVDDAVDLYNGKQYTLAWNRAVKSLKYSVGIFGAEYNKALSL